MPVVSRAIQDSPLDEPGRAGVFGRPWRGVLLPALWIQRWLGLRLGVRGCAGGCRWSDRFLVLLYSSRFVREGLKVVGFEQLASSKPYLISLNMWCCGILVKVS